MTSFILMSDSPCILQDFVSAGSLQSRCPKWHFSHITSLHWSWLLIINKTLMFKYFCLILNMIDMKRITFSFQDIHPLLIVHIQTMNHFIFLTKYINFFFFLQWWIHNFMISALIYHLDHVCFLLLFNLLLLLLLIPSHLTVNSTVQYQKNSDPCRAVCSTLCQTIVTGYRPLSGPLPCLHPALAPQLMAGQGYCWPLYLIAKICARDWKVGGKQRQQQQQQ